MLDVSSILALHAETVERWHRDETVGPFDGFLELVCQQHEQNYRLWHEEDIARSPDVTDAEIARVKRAIDKLNQQRNDLIERLDDNLIEQLGQQGILPQPDARLNSETPGSVIDRLSILSLRLYHMEEQTRRADASAEHVAKAAARLAILRRQHADLAGCLAELLHDIFAGRKVLRVYRQFKMYNDPTMNPYLYHAARREAA